MGVNSGVFIKRAYSTGKNNLITDVAGITVGHADVRQGCAQTGVTVLVPTMDNIFLSKRAAACHVINGFGKSQGLVQIDELGTLETPIVLTNTLAVGACWDALAHYMVEQNPDLTSVNPVVMECNDSTLNDIRAFHLDGDMVREALDQTTTVFAEGAVGAGRGMICHGLSGGIGSASRVFALADHSYTIGALVLTNHGLLKDLVISGDPVGERLAAQIETTASDKGSVIVLLATDAPLGARNLGRLCRRAVVGLSRVGGHIGHGSGEIALAFSTANIILHKPDGPIIASRDVADGYLDTVFRAAIECVEEAVVSSLWHAETVTGRNGNIALALRDMPHG